MTCAAASEPATPPTRPTSNESAPRPTVAVESEPGSTNGRRSWSAFRNKAHPRSAITAEGRPRQTAPWPAHLRWTGPEGGLMQNVMIQAAVPVYRQDIVAGLAQRCGGDFSLYCGAASFEETLQTDVDLGEHHRQVRNRYLLNRRLLWQHGVLGPG